MSGLKSIAVKSLWHFLKSHLAIALGVAAATAVIVGALVVGDSVRHSLRGLVVDRLGNIECSMHSRVFFSSGLLQDIELESMSSDDAEGLKVVPAILFPSSTVESRNQELTRATQVQLLGIDQNFSTSIQSAKIDSFPKLGPDEVVINEMLATELGVGEGDEITILIKDPSGLPSDNPLGRRDDKTISLPRQKIVSILPDQSVGGISFLPNQEAPRNVFAHLETVQDILDSEGRINASLVLTNGRPRPSGFGQRICDQINLQIKPTLEDYGLELTRHLREFPDAKRREKADGDPKLVHDYFQVTASQLVMDKSTSKSLTTGLSDLKPIRLVTYLANSIKKIQPTRALYFETRRYQDGPSMRAHSIGASMALQDAEARSKKSEETVYLSREVTYSIVVGMDGPLYQMLGKEHYNPDLKPYAWLREPFCWINSWLAKEIDAKAGDWIEISYYLPETVDGRRIEESQFIMVAGVVPVVEPKTKFQRRRQAVYETSPTIFNDPGLTPSVPGITDQDSILDWDLPFKLEKKVPDADDNYWENHRLTPKIFLPHVYAVDFFESRFGQETGFRIPFRDRLAEETVTSDLSAEEFETKVREQAELALLPTRESKGLKFSPVRQQQLSAASGTTPFDALFLSLSFFVIVAALLLVYLLLKLGLQQRTGELGILQAQGFSPARIQRLLLTEFAIVAAIGVAIGLPLGLAYARGIIAGLESWWIDAISTRFLVYTSTPLSILIGCACGFFASLLAIYFGVRKASRVQPLANLRLQASNPGKGRLNKKLYLAISGLSAIVAIGLAFAGMGQAGMAKAGFFFGSGILLLAACMFAVRQWIDLTPDPSNTSETTSSQALRFGSLSQMAWRAIGRNPGRSLLSLSLLSVATFLIASMGVFQLSPTERGYGGFNLIGETSQPIYDNIGFGTVRSDRLGDDAKRVVGSSIVPLRARFGADASCNNLFKVTEPTILGVPERLAEIHDYASNSIEFEWAGTSNPENPWSALKIRSAGSEYDPIPVILDQNTAMWSLKQGASIGATIVLEIENRKLYFKTIGLLSNSIMQGKLLISEQNFQFAFPEVSGYSYFLINSGERAEPTEVASVLETGWANEGMDVQYSEDLLKRYLGVQNTYISAFQSLGALGLLLGTFGLIAVQVRSVLERRREFALMRAVGFSSPRLAQILTLETAILLIGGMLIGILCAAVALTPFVIEVGPQLTLIGPVLMLLGVLVVGSVAAFIAIRAVNKQPILEGLRSE